MGHSDAPSTPLALARYAAAGAHPRPFTSLRFARAWCVPPPPPFTHFIRYGGAVRGPAATLRSLTGAPPTPAHFTRLVWATPAGCAGRGVEGAVPLRSRASRPHRSLHTPRAPATLRYAWRLLRGRVYGAPGAHALHATRAAGAGPRSLHPLRYATLPARERGRCRPTGARHLARSLPPTGDAAKRLVPPHAIPLVSLAPLGVRR